MFSSLMILQLCLILCVWARSGTNSIRGACSRRWELILSHDEFGNVTFGSKEELLSLAMGGNHVKASIYMPDHLLQLPAHNVIKKSNQLCVQSLRALAHNGTHVDGDFPLLFFMVCTTGHVTERDVLTSSVFRVPADWYVKDIGSGEQPIYSNYLDGSITSGSSVDRLHEAARSMGLVGAMRDKAYVFPLNNVMLDLETGEVNGQSTMHIGQKYVDNYVTFYDVPYQWLSHWSTLGHRDNARWSLQQHTAYTHNADMAAVDWYVDSCWRLVYSNNELGQDLYGSVDDLIGHIERGHRVRVRYNDVNMEASNVRVKNGVVTAQLLREVSRVGNNGHDRYYIEQDTHTKITLIHTTGKVNSYDYLIGTPTKKTIPPVRKDVEWMVDTRPWKTVLKTVPPSNAVDKGSSLELSEAVMAGASIRLKLTDDAGDGDFFIEANNMRVDFTSDTIYAQALDCISEKRSRIINEFELQISAYNKYYQIASDGTVQLSNWNIGLDTFKSDEVVSPVTVTWFANL